jgi:hypothetical protein
MGRRRSLVEPRVKPGINRRRFPGENPVENGSAPVSTSVTSQDGASAPLSWRQTLRCLWDRISIRILLRGRSVFSAGTALEFSASNGAIEDAVMRRGRWAARRLNPAEFRHRSLIEPDWASLWFSVPLPPGSHHGRQRTSGNCAVSMSAGARSDRLTHFNFGRSISAAAVRQVARRFRRRVMRINGSSASVSISANGIYRTVTDGKLLITESRLS